MSMPTTLQALHRHWDDGRFVCLGLDPQIKSIPEVVKQPSDIDTIVAFNRAIIEATHDVVAAYKPNVAFFEAYGAEGWRALEATVVSIRQHNPRVVIILDAKRGDIGSTNTGYVTSAFDTLGADATTLNPYLGRESLKPYLQRTDRMMFILCRTSNDGANEFQDLPVCGGMKLFEYVAERVAREWNTSGNLGLVVGATSPNELQSIRRLVPELPLLIPGVGAQGGDVDAVVRAVRSAGRPNILVNSSRAILYADRTADFATKARQVASELSRSLAEGLC
jgi:orotidine-5'-phosphate decarboxylase